LLGRFVRRCASFGGVDFFSLPGSQPSCDSIYDTFLGWFCGYVISDISRRAPVAQTGKRPAVSEPKIGLFFCNKILVWIIKFALK